MSLDDFIERDLHANDNDGENLTLRVCVDEHSDTDLCNLFNELRENTTVERVWIGTEDEGFPDLVLGVKPSLALTAAILQHPTINALSFYRIDIISNFGAIAVAIQQSKSLDELDLYSCDLSREQMAALEWLLAENGIERITIDTCYPANNVFCIAQGLESNQSLQKLYIENVEVEDGDEIIWSVSAETMEAIPRLLRQNKVIESIELRYIDVPSEFITRIAEAAIGHESLSDLTLRKIGETGVKELPNLIEANSRVKTIDLRFNSLSNAEAVALSSALKVNTNLEVLNLMHNEIGVQGAAAIAEALRSNVGLKDINLCWNPIGDDGAAALANALTENTTLTHLSISHFGLRGFNSFSSCLPFMNGLKHLTFHRLNGLTKMTADAFLKALERNTELEEMIFVDGFVDEDTAMLCKEMTPKIEYQMTVNRAGKRILKSKSRVPDSLWPLILAKSSKAPDALYFFLREKPDVLINNAPPARASRKRKRGWFSGWF